MAWSTLALTLALIGFQVPSGLADEGAPADMRADISADRVNLRGDGDLTAQAYLFGLADTKDPVGLSYWRASAEIARVTIITERSRVIASALNVGGTLEGEPNVTTSKAEYVEVQSTSLRMGEQAYFFVTGPAQDEPGRFGVSAPGHDVTFQADDSVWYDHRVSSSEDPLGRGQPPILEWTVPNVDVSFVGQDDLIFRLTGDVSMTVFDTDFLVRDADGVEHSYETGIFWHNETGQTPATAHGVIAEMEERKAVIEFTNATLDYSMDGPIPSLQVAGFEFHGSGQVQLVNAKGAMSVGASRTDVSNRFVVVDGPVVALDMQPHGSSSAAAQARIEGTLQGKTSYVSLDGELMEIRPATAQNVGVRQMLLPWGWWVGILSCVAAGTFAVALYRRRRSFRSEDLLQQAEKAFKRHDYDRALRRTQHILARDPTQLDATVLRAVTLLRLGRPTDALEFLQGQRKRVSGDSGLLQLLTSLSLIESGREGDGIQELQDVLETYPHLRDEVEGTELMRKAAKNPSLQRFRGKDVSGAGYT